MISRRRTTLLGLAALLVAPGPLIGQTKKSAPRVAVVMGGSRSATAPYLDAFVEAMAKLGYVNGRNVVLDVRSAEGNLERFPEIVGEVVRLKPDVIVLSGTQAIRAAKAATSSIPIVMAAVGAPVEQGLISSLARPGGNITGIAVLSEALVPKSLELIRDILPKASRVAFISNPASAATPVIVKRVEAAAANLGLTVLKMDASNAQELDAALEKVAVQRPDAILTTENALFREYRKKLIDFASRHRIPAIVPFSEAVSEGGLVSYTTNLSEMYRKSATYVHRILSGVNPGDLPVEQAMHFELFLNLKTARALGIKIPPSVMLRADRVIE